MKIVLTGGHLSPLLSVIDGLSKENDKILVIGRKHALEGDKVLSLEYQTLIDKKVEFVSINTARFQRKFTRYTLLSFVKFPYGVIQSLSILKKFKPNVVLSFGGYIALPVVFSAYILRIPIVLHEQTLETGLSNKIAAFFAKKVCISWLSSAKFFNKDKVVLTGNPIRSDFLKIDSKNYSKKERPVIYVTGGSLGSHFLNLFISDCIKDFVQNYTVFHQTGAANNSFDFNNLKKIRDSLGSFKERYILSEFVKPEDVGKIISQADLVISRSGVNTITELIYLGKPAILVPLVFSQKNEQLKNALFFKELGLGEILEKNASSNDLCQKVILMLSNINNYKKSGEKAKGLIKKEAAENIINVLKSCANK
ncbi:MAG: UDP-N-acetylglucosamine--N-acetylmuramyl-(pentapeptide) pyrophosphoryl-undecaprenol N-acetylglucosamine transferase [bacterium]|nr:UDP-N-acetylglucosamine--N-acetylmuramyl-(pentapeptide) pyrophosphoryl-undecaprenol N-acetylglucosamine transferase [bacterium]